MNIGKGISYIGAGIVMATAIHHATFFGYLTAFILLFIARTDVEGHLDD